VVTVGARWRKRWFSTIEDEFIIRYLFFYNNAVPTNELGIPRDDHYFRFPDIHHRILDPFGILFLFFLKFRRNIDFH